MTWIDGWKKTIVYGALSALPIAWPSRLWLSYVAGGQLITLALMYLVLSFKGKRRRRRRDHLLGHGDIDSFESSNRFEEVTEVLDDGLPEPIPGSSHSLSDSLAEQEAILEI